MICAARSILLLVCISAGAAGDDATRRAATTPATRPARVLMPLEFRSSAYGYALALPPGWAAYSRAELDREIARSVTADAELPPRLDAAFYVGDSTWPDAKVLVQVVRYSTNTEPDTRQMKTIMRRFVHEQPTTRELTPAALRSADRTHVTEPQFDSDSRTFRFDRLIADPIAGPIRQHSVGHFGHTALVVVTTAVPDEKHQRFAEDLARIHKSFRFDADSAYQGGWTAWRNLIIILAVALAALVWLVWRYTRRPAIDT